MSYFTEMEKSTVIKTYSSTFLPLFFITDKVGLIYVRLFSKAAYNIGLTKMLGSQLFIFYLHSAV